MSNNHECKCSRRPKGGAAAKLIADSEERGVDTARRALELHRAGVHHIDAAAKLGCSVSAYYRALERGREEARAELVVEAVDAHLELVAGHRQQIARLEADAELARADGFIRSATAAESAARATREALAKLWGVNSPDPQHPVVCRDWRMVR